MTRSVGRTCGGLTLVAALMLGPTAVPVAAQDVDPRQLTGATLSGTVTDPLERPIEVCVYARLATPIGSLGQVVKGTTDPATGAYSFAVHPGTYDVWAYSPFPITEEFPEPCRDPFWSRVNTEEFVGQGPLRVEVLPTGSADFALEYYVAGGGYGRYCCIGNGVQPGEDIELRAWTSRNLRGDVEMFWQDETTGTTVELPWDGPSVIALYDAYGCRARASSCGESPVTGFTMPLGEGWYPYSFWAQTHDGIRVTPVRQGGVWVDATPPVVESTVPADGSDDVEAGNVRIRAIGHDPGSGLWSTRLVVTDLEAPDPPAFDDTEYSRSWRTFSIPLEADRTYEAVFTLTDNADNVTTHTITFSTVEPAPPCHLPCQLVGALP